MQYVRFCQSSHIDAIFPFAYNLCTGSAKPSTKRKEKTMTAKELAMQYAKEITIAKMNDSAQSPTNYTFGKSIGDMYEAIYNKIYEIASTESSD